MTNRQCNKERNGFIQGILNLPKGQIVDVVDVHMDYIHGQNFFFLAQTLFLPGSAEDYIQEFLICLYVLNMTAYMFEPYIRNIIWTCIHINVIQFCIIKRKHRTNNYGPLLFS